jgi:hypothetical protein
MTTGVSLRFRKVLAVGDADLESDTIKAILMATGYTFNPDTHTKYADVSASELATGNGYTTGGQSLTGVALTESTTNDRLEVTWDTVSWTATSGSIGPTPGMILVDDTITTAGGAATAKPILGYIDFGTGLTQVAGGSLNITNIQLDI